MGELRLSEVRWLAQAHLAVNELCGLGKFPEPQLQQFKVNDLSVTRPKQHTCLVSLGRTNQIL